MGLLSRNKQRGEAASCEHPKLDPRWDRIEDAGQGDRVDHYVCRGCGASFSHEQADTFLQRSADAGERDPDLSAAQYRL